MKYNNIKYEKKLNLKKDFSIVQSETGEYILRTPYKSYFIPEIHKEIIELLNLNCSTNEIVEKLGVETNYSEINRIINESFERMGILQGSEYDHKQKKRMLHFKRDIIAPGFLYNKNVMRLFYNKYFIVAVFFFYFLIYTYGISKWSGLQLLTNFTLSLNLGFVAVTYIIIYFSSSLVHELGHYLTCLYLGGTPGKIGIGIYMVTPVLYADLNDLWRLSIKKRNIINFAGMYFQSLFLLIFAFIAIIIQQQIAFAICCLGSFFTLLNLFPFVKFDGYWIINDYLGTNDLISKATIYLLTLTHIKSMPCPYKSNAEIKNVIFKVYSIFFGFFLLFYTYYFIKNFVISLVSLYKVCFYGNLDIDFISLFFRSAFVVFTSIRVLSVLKFKLK